MLTLKVLMSKGQHGNKEAKKPKKEAAKPLPPGAALPATAPPAKDMLRKK